METLKYPLEGLYSAGKYVIVIGKQQQIQIADLGCFGSDLQEAKRREISQKGATNSNHIDKYQSLHPPLSDEPLTILTLHEAFFLAHAFDCLTIKDNQDKLMDLRDCWKSFSDYDKRFPKEYAVYFYFRTRGWVVKEGINYGVTFLLYKHSPTKDHARYGVIICDNSHSFQSLLTFHRVIQSVKKELLLVFLSTPTNSNLSYDQITPNSLKDITITTKVFKAHPDFIPKKCSNMKPIQSLEDYNCT